MRGWNWRVGLAVVMLVGAAATPGPARSATTAAMPWDFNGDRYADLAVGVPGEDLVAGEYGAGAVNVLYGSATGITAAGDQVWTQDSTGVLGTADQYDGFGADLASADFDRDGYADLAIMTYTEVAILYGSSIGLSASGDQLWPLASACEGCQAGVRALAVAAADFDADGFGDLAVGWTDYDATSAVAISYGGLNGLSLDGTANISRATPGVPGEPALGGLFGIVLVAGDFDGDGPADLAATVGEPYGQPAAATVVVLYGDQAGLSGVGAQAWSQDSPGIAEQAEGADQLGASLAAGDLNGDGRDDLAIGVPGEDHVPSCAAVQCGRGAVHVIYGTASGLSATGSQIWRQNTPGVPGAGEDQDLFGRGLAAGDFNGDRRDDLAIGIPGESITGLVGSRHGQVLVLNGSAAGLTTAGARNWSQNSAGVPNSAERNDAFGQALAAGHFGRSGREDLVVGVPGESFSGLSHPGVVNVLYGTWTGLTGSRAQVWSQASTGVLERADNADQFGAVLGD